MPDSRLEFPFGENDRAYQLAFLLQCIADLKLEYDAAKQAVEKDFEGRISNLEMDVARLQRNILTGQKEMFEPPPMRIKEDSTGESA